MKEILAINSAPDPMEPRIERQGNVVRIEKKEASYVIAYGRHSKPQDPNEIPDNSRAVFLEASGDWTQYWNAHSFLAGDVQYGELVTNLKERRIPIYFADVDRKEIITPVELGVEFTEFLAGVGLMYSAFKGKSNDSNPQTFDRRKFFTKTGKALAGLYLSTPFISNGLMYATYKTELAQKTVETNKFIYNMHPELNIILLSFRNVVIGFKEQWVAESMADRPIIATVIGAGHVGLEEVLQSAQQDKLEYLQKFKPVLRSLVRTPETFYTIRVNTDYGYAKNLIVPELKELWDSSAELNSNSIESDKKS
ncbi:MAG: hypothetical protein M3M85_00340 [bacterium]|nr:hypothetical protein [bacterium]